MPFKIKDLMITVLPPHIEGDEIVSEPGFPPDGGGGGGGPNSVFSDPRFSIDDLRMTLQLALIQVGGPLRAEEMQPRSIADLDSLEAKLSDALQEVRDLRAKFSGIDLN